MITKSEYDAYAAHGCANYIEVDRQHAAALLAEALKTATNTRENRVDCARLAFETAAHYERLAQFDGLDEYAREFAHTNIGFYTLRGTLLLTDCTDAEINDACTRLLKKTATQ
jgi:hypothetical protein